MNRREISLKITAAVIAVMIVISSVAILRVMVGANPENDAKSGFDIHSIPSRPCELETVLTPVGSWVRFDSTDPGTPAEAHVLISDTTGITIVADFHGFWRNNYTIDSTRYDDIKMPGTSSINVNGTPMLPVLTELVEIPHDIDVSLEVLASSNDTERGYKIRPASPLNYPVGIGRHSSIVATNQTTIQPTIEGPVYTNDNLFPVVRANISGRTGAAPLIVRGHRFLKLSFYPVQYNHQRDLVMVFSQIAVKIIYSTPAQIQPVRESLRSKLFESIFKNSLMHYDPIHVKHQQPPGLPTSYSRIPPPPSSLPNATVPQFHYSSVPPGYVPGAEYLIITTDSFEFQAQRLAEWKERKGIPSAVITLETRTRDDKIVEIKSHIKYAYDHWYPAPTYVLLFGDVETIPTNYDMIHPGWMFEQDYIASDLGYFNIEGHSYFPDMIYSRISVDTEEQAEIIVNKTIQYEQSPPVEKLFYNSIMTAGQFIEAEPGVEYEREPFIYSLERVRKYLKDELNYSVHYNYSCYTDQETRPTQFYALLNDSDPKSIFVNYTIDEEYDWLGAYERPGYYNSAKGNITKNIDDGRFLVLYYGHGGSRNLLYPFDWGYNYTTRGKDGVHNNEDRDIWEGWQTPYFNTSYMQTLANGNMTPLIVSIACSTGWFDGETDHLFTDLDHFDGVPLEENPFEDFSTECFAEEILRLEEGAIAAISPTRPAPGLPSTDLLNGMIQAIWPGFLGDRSQPIYEMGGILLAGKLNAASKWMGKENDPARQIFEEFHLFGDPETQLWTAEPLDFEVTHPASIGTMDSQKFVVTVRNNTQEPIDNAKVCIQQDSWIYQVGYTDSRGQVVFEVDPHDISSSLNVTVTKHNHKPYMGEILVVKSQLAKVSVSPGSDFRQKTINVSGFNENYDVLVYFEGDEIPAIIRSRTHLAVKFVPDGTYGYVNVWAVQEQESLIATTCFLRLSSDKNPDPYIYSYADTSTWELAGEELVWDNPCITIYDGSTPVKRVTQNRNYTVNVTVYNRGSGDAERCNVTLRYAPFVGGVTWDYLGKEEVTVPLFQSRNVSFTWRPRLANTACLKVELDVENETEEDKINNVGYECWSVLPICSKRVSDFDAVNPTDEPEYVFINVKQVGHEDDIWSATVNDYASQPIDNGDSDTVGLEFDPSHRIGSDESRLFTAEIYIEAELMGGVVFEGICDPPFPWPFIFMILFLVFMIAMVIYCYKN